MASVITNKNKKNYMINGNFDYWQRGTTLTPTPNGFVSYLADRFALYEDGTSVLNYDQSTDVPNSNSLYSAKVTVGTAGTSSAAQSAFFLQRVEGKDFKPLIGKTFTLSFYVKSSITGIYCLNFRNNASDKSYVAEYTINSANTWEKKSITIVHEGTGVWEKDENVGIRIGWFLSVGSNYHTTKDAWQDGIFLGTSAQTDFINNAAATWQISQVMLNEGAVAGPFQTAGVNTEGEIALCQRYYEKSYYSEDAPGTATAVGATMWKNSNGGAAGIEIRHTQSFLVEKRTFNPTMSWWDLGGGSGQFTVDIINGRVIGGGAFSTSNKGFIGDLNTNVAGVKTQFHWAVDAEL